MMLIVTCAVLSYKRSKEILKQIYIRYCAGNFDGLLNSPKAGEIHISILIAFVALHSNINYYVYNSF